MDPMLSLVDKAKAGDPAALKLCIERLISKAKQDQGISFNMPEGRTDSGENMLAIAKGITEAVTSGQMTMTEAKEFKSLLEEQIYLFEKAEQTIKDEEWKRKLNL